MPGCPGGAVGLLQAAIDRAVQQPGGPIVNNDLAASGGHFDTPRLGHDDAPGSELILNHSAAGWAEFDDDATTAAVGQ